MWGPENVHKWMSPLLFLSLIDKLFVSAIFSAFFLGDYFWILDANLEVPRGGYHSPHLCWSLSNMYWTDSLRSLLISFRGRADFSMMEIRGGGRRGGCLYNIYNSKKILMCLREVTVPLRWCCCNKMRIDTMASRHSPSYFAIESLVMKREGNTIRDPQKEPCVIF